VVTFLLLSSLLLQVSLLLLMFLVMLVSLHVPDFQASLALLFLQLQLVGIPPFAGIPAIASISLFLLFQTRDDNVFYCGRRLFSC
jgi:hypothetical protein